MADRPDSYCLRRTYTIPADLVRSGKNVIAVRVHSDKFGGGMTGPAVAMHLSCPTQPETAPVSLDGKWKYAVEQNYGEIVFPEPLLGPNSQNLPSVLFNGMISPLIPFGIRGVIWYQGESNTSWPSQYRTLFPVMIQDWRKHWNQKHFPFMFVQLANFGLDSIQPQESAWAELREAQTVALQLPETGMAVAIDIGDANDIHPLNKQDVGLRLSFNALAKVYGEPIPYSGPRFKSLTKSGNTLQIDFDQVSGSLKCHGDKLAGFVIAGDDRKFVRANAEINGARVIVSSPAVPKPKFVYYAWADSPVCNLYDAAGLPAIPFRSDLPGQT